MMSFGTGGTRNTKILTTKWLSRHECECHQDCRRAVLHVLLVNDVPVQIQTLLGVVREAWTGASPRRGLCLTQSECAAKILEDAVKLGFGPIRVSTTTGQSGTPPDPK